MILQLFCLMASGCLTSSGNGNKQTKSYRSGRNQFSSSSSESSKRTIRRRYLTLNKGETFQTTTHIHTEENEPIYGRYYRS